MILTELADHYGTDKGLLSHNYTSKYYEHYLQDKKDEDIILLELGIKNGASLCMWRDYFQKGLIIGVDKDKVTVSGDIRQYNCLIPEDLDALAATIDTNIGGLDFIIDDLSHEPEHQAQCLHRLFPLLKDDGLYFIEDCFSSYIKGDKGLEKLMMFDFYKVIYEGSGFIHLYPHFVVLGRENSGFRDYIQRDKRPGITK